jgi:hypothetical protein
MMMAVVAGPNAEGAVHGADAGSHGASDDGADRTESAIAGSGAAAGTADEALRIRG